MEDFVLLPGGSPDFGVLEEDVARAIGRQVGAVRLRRCDLEHIEARHGEEIRGLGFDGAIAFVSETLSRANAIYQGHGIALIAADIEPKPNRGAILELQPAKDESGDHYAVKSALPLRVGYLDGKRRLLMRDGLIAHRFPGSETFRPSLGAEGSLDPTEKKNKIEEKTQWNNSRAKHRKNSLDRGE